MKLRHKPGRPFLHSLARPPSHSRVHPRVRPAPTRDLLYSVSPSPNHVASVLPSSHRHRTAVARPHPERPPVLMSPPHPSRLSRLRIMPPPAPSWSLLPHPSCWPPLASAPRLPQPGPPVPASHRHRRCRCCPHRHLPIDAVIVLQSTSLRRRPPIDVIATVVLRSLTWPPSDPETQISQSTPSSPPQSSTTPSPHRPPIPHTTVADHIVAVTIDHAIPAMVIQVRCFYAISLEHSSSPPSFNHTHQVSSCLLH
jgi:hypothetical protein